MHIPTFAETDALLSCALASNPVQLEAARPAIAAAILLYELFCHRAERSAEKSKTKGQRWPIDLEGRGMASRCSNLNGSLLATVHERAQLDAPCPDTAAAFVAGAVMLTERELYLLVAHARMVMRDIQDAILKDKE